MSSPTLRPSFWIAMPQPPEQALARLATDLAQSDPPLDAQRSGLHMTLTVGPAQRHLWSPWLHLDFGATPPAPEPEAAGGTHLHGRFSPSPALWTGFMMLYLTLASLTGFALLFAVAQLVMGVAPTTLWGAAAGLLAWLSLWGISLAGQRLARDQITQLRDRVHHALGFEADALGAV